MIVEKSGFYTSPIGQEPRYYDASDWSTLVRHLTTSGVFLNEGGLMASVGEDGTTIEVTQGFVYLDGHWYDMRDENTATRFIHLPQPATSMPYIGRVVVRSEEGGQRKAYQYWKAGDESNTPVPPPLERENGVYEVCLWEQLVRPGMPLQSGDGKDTRLNREICGVADFAPNPKLEPVLMQGFTQSYPLEFSLPVEGWASVDKSVYPDHVGEWCQRFPTAMNDDNIYSDCDGLFTLSYQLRKQGVASPSEVIVERGGFVAFYPIKPLIAIRGKMLFLRGGKVIG